MSTTRYDEMRLVVIVVGMGMSNIPAIRAAESLPENWLLAHALGVGGERVAEIATGERGAEDEWCVVLGGDNVDPTALDSDPAVATYQRIPEDSPALATWRAGVVVSGRPGTRNASLALAREALLLFAETPTEELWLAARHAVAAASEHTSEGGVLDRILGWLREGPGANSPETIRRWADRVNTSSG